MKQLNDKRRVTAIVSTTHNVLFITLPRAVGSDEYGESVPGSDVVTLSMYKGTCSGSGLREGVSG